jgi:hypothetical protein
MDRQSPDDFLARHGEFVEPAKLEALNRQAEKFAREKANGGSHPTGSQPDDFPKKAEVPAKRSNVAIVAGSEPLPLVPPIPPARPYPLAALGEVLSGAAESIAAKCQCSPALAAQAVLAVASLAAQRLADIRLPFRQTRPLSLYFVTIAASGDRKSTADNEALIPVRMYEKNLKREYETAHSAWRVRYAAWDAEPRPRGGANGPWKCAD